MHNQERIISKEGEKRIDSKKASLNEIFFQKGCFFPLSMESPFRSFHNMILLSFMLLSVIIILFLSSVLYLQFSSLRLPKLSTSAFLSAQQSKGK